MSQRDETLMQMCVQPLMGPGTVTAIDAASGLCVVQTRHGEFTARRAASCLLAPESGDRVWLTGDLSEGLYVTAVLERAASEAPVRIGLPAGSRIEAEQGALYLEAEQLRLHGRAQFALQADSATLCTRQFSAVGGEITASFGRIKLLGDLLESFVDRVVQFARWSQRTVAGIDQVRAAQIDYRAEQTLQLQAHDLVANATQLLKVDGEQIHMG